MAWLPFTFAALLVSQDLRADWHFPLGAKAPSHFPTIQSSPFPCRALPDFPGCLPCSDCVL